MQAGPYPSLCAFFSVRVLPMFQSGQNMGFKMFYPYSPQQH